MRVLDTSDPRWMALMLVPVLLAAGTGQPEAAVPRSGIVLAAPQHAPVVVPFRAPTAATAAPAVAEPAAPLMVQAGREARPSRAALRRNRGPLTVEERGRAALRALAYDPASLGYRVRFLPYRGDLLGTTHRRSRLITVYVQRGQSELTLRTTIAHELGHALDFAHGDDERRDAYRQVRGLPGGRWFPCDSCDEYASPAGDFAEVFAVWLAGPGDFRSRLAGPPTPAQLRELAPLFAVPGRPAQAPRAATPSPAPEPPQEPSDESDSVLSALLGPPPSPSPDRR